jgi:hypothetical protein
VAPYQKRRISLPTGVHACTVKYARICALELQLGRGSRSVPFGGWQLLELLAHRAVFDCSLRSLRCPQGCRHLPLQNGGANIAWNPPPPSSLPEQRTARAVSIARSARASWRSCTSLDPCGGARFATLTARDSYSPAPIRHAQLPSRLDDFSGAARASRFGIRLLRRRSQRKDASARSSSARRRAIFRHSQPASRRSAFHHP